MSLLRSMWNISKAYDFYTENGKTSHAKLERRTPSCPRAQHSHLGMIISVYILASRYILHKEEGVFFKKIGIDVSSDQNQDQCIGKL